MDVLEIKNITLIEARPFISGDDLYADYLEAYSKGNLGVFGVYEVGELIGAYGMEMRNDGFAHMLFSRSFSKQNMFIQILPQIEADAKKRGAKGFMLSTTRAGLMRKLAARAGPENKLFVSWEFKDV